MPRLLRSSCAGAESYRLSEENRASLDAVIDRELHGRPTWALRLPDPVSPHHHHHHRPRPSSYPLVTTRFSLQAEDLQLVSPSRERRFSIASVPSEGSRRRFQSSYRFRARIREWWRRWSSKDSIRTESSSSEYSNRTSDLPRCRRHSIGVFSRERTHFAISKSRRASLA